VKFTTKFSPRDTVWCVEETEEAGAQCPHCKLYRRGKPLGKIRRCIVEDLSFHTSDRFHNKPETYYTCRPTRRGAKAHTYTEDHVHSTLKEAQAFAKRWQRKARRKQIEESKKY